MRKTRVTTILGTRPELIRLSCIIEELDKRFEHRLVHTGQNFDDKLSKVFFDELSIRPPDVSFDFKNGTLGKFLSIAFMGVEEELEKNPTDAIVLLGDTNSALAGIIGKRKGIPIYHLEAGNRSFDSNVPEETNRKIIDHFADFNMAYTEHARRNLLQEGLHPRNTIVIGSPMLEVIERHRRRIEESEILKQLNLLSGNYFLLSAHRQENIDKPDRIKLLATSLNSVVEKYKIPIIVSTHPRLRDRLQELHLELNSDIKFYEPFGFFDYCKLQKESRVVLSDSGSVSEESAILGFPAITVRDSMERPEALEAGVISMSGLTPEGLIQAILQAENTTRSPGFPMDYFIPNTSQRVVNFISSTANLHKFWNGVRD
jgi:UDP-N-acetylglucosamine 2-epimerase (non-hydrolysing)